MGERYGRSRAALPLYHLAPATPDQRSAYGGRFKRAGCGLWIASLDRGTAPILCPAGVWYALPPASGLSRPAFGVLRWSAVRAAARSVVALAFRRRGFVVCASSLLVVSRRHPVVPAPGVWACSVYIGRPSPLGSPFPISRFGRAGSIQRYRAWLRSQVQAGLAGRGGPAWRALLAIAGLVRAGLVVHLVCWCAPLACHGGWSRLPCRGCFSRVASESGAVCWSLGSSVVGGPVGGV